MDLGKIIFCDTRFSCGCLQFIGGIAVERYYWGALSAAVGLGNSKLEALVAVFGSARSAYLADRQELLAARVYKEAAIDKFLKFRNLALPEQLQNFCERQQVRLMISSDADYPVSLRHIALPPKVLYIKGNLQYRYRRFTSSFYLWVKGGG